MLPATDPTGAIETFIATTKAALADLGSTDACMERIVAAMRDLVAATDATSSGEVMGNIHESRQDDAERPGPLYQDATGLTLVRARFGPEALTPIHSHGSWGVIGVYHGRDRYQIWRRVDRGDGPGEAQIELVEERELGRGDVVILPAPPQDIHAQQGLDGQPVFEYVLFGADATRLPRLYFDVETGVAEQVIPEGAR